LPTVTLAAGGYGGCRRAGSARLARARLRQPGQCPL